MMKEVHITTVTTATSSPRYFGEIKEPTECKVKGMGRIIGADLPG
jgi:hypothetical protein